MADQDQQKRRRRKAADKRSTRSKKRQDTSSAAGAAVAGLVNNVLPVVTAVVAFVAVVLLFRHVFPVSEEVAVSADAPAEAAPAVSSSNPDVQDYAGVESPWLSDPFTMGNKDLDSQVKAFCDALSVEGQGAKENAQNVYNNVVWSSSYVERAQNELPEGTDWAVAAARHYFATGSPEEGVGGEGDNYEFAAVTSYCLRYFGYSDALAVPILTSASGYQEGSAVVLLTDEYGFGCLCDPSLGANGWMLDRDTYSIMVENIDQDLTPTEDMGLPSQRREQSLEEESYAEEEEPYIGEEPYTEEEYDTEEYYY